MVFREPIDRHLTLVVGPASHPINDLPCSPEPQYELQFALPQNCGNLMLGKVVFSHSDVPRIIKALRQTHSFVEVLRPLWNPTTDPPEE
jgi:hypothetical protein